MWRARRQQQQLWTPLSDVLLLKRQSRHHHHHLPSLPLRKFSNNHLHPPPPSTTATCDRRFLSISLTLNFSSVTQSSNESNPTPPRCWSCNSEPKRLPFLFCDSCRAVQPVDHSVDYFGIFGLEKKCSIVDDNLEGTYKDWQKKVHPDLVHLKSEKERQFAAEQSARVIDAYRTLTNPLSRAIYILELEGVDFNEEETVSDPELLAEIMEIREAVEETSNAHDLNEIRSQMQEKLQHWSKSFANAFQSKDFEEARDCIRRMTYYDRVNEEILKRL